MRVVTAGDGYAFQQSRVVHFGMGAHGVVSELEVVWPGGRRQRFTDMEADRLIEIDEDTADIKLVVGR